MTSSRRDIAAGALPPGADPLALAARLLGELCGLDAAPRSVARAALPASIPAGSRVVVTRTGPGEGDAALLAEDGASLGRLDGLRLQGAPAPLRLDGGLVMMFSGQGGQRARMGAELADRAFRDAFEEALAALDGPLDPPLRQVLTAAAGSDVAKRLDQTAWTQPAMFALQVGLARAWEARGARPAAVLGHSFGEIAAAHVAGVMDLPDAARLALARGAALAALPPGGAMAALQASEADAAALVRERPGVVLAAVNSPDQTVISGDEGAVLDVVEAARSAGLRATRLVSSVAFHSHHVEPAMAPFAAAIDGLRLQPPRLPVISDGRAVGAEIATVAWWTRQLRAPVRFAGSLRAALAADAGALLEIGPGAELCAFARAIVDRSVPVVSSLERGRPESLEPAAQALAAAGHAAAAPMRAPGVGVLDHPWLRLRVPLPDGGLLLLGGVDHVQDGWLRDHVVAGRPLLPGAAFVELLLAAAREAGLEGIVALQLEAPLPLGDRPVELQVRIEAPAGGRRAAQVHARSDAAWVRHARGELGPVGAADGEAPGAPAEGGAAELYARLAASGLGYGPAFRTVVGVAGLRATVEVARADGFLLHPALLDGALHPLAAAADGEAALLPFELRDVRLDAAGQTRAAVSLQATPTAGGVSGAARLVTTDGRRIASLGAVHARRAQAGRSALLHTLTWLPHAADAAPRGRWVVVGDGAHAERVADSLRGAGAAVERAADFAGPDADAAGWVWALPDGGEGPEAARATAELALGALQHLVQRIPAPGQRRWVVLSAEGADLGQAAAVGLLRSARAEHGAAAPFTLHLGDGPVPAWALAAGDEPEARVRAGVREVPRLVRAPGGAGAPLGSGTVLVTGGTSGIGAAVAVHLAAHHGVRDLVLTSRRGAEAPEAAEVVRAVAAHGARATVVASDAADGAAVHALLAAIPAERPLVAVLHAAGVVDDALLTDTTPERLARVLRPKIDGAWNLHRHAGPEVKLVLFSSISGVVGTGGQCAYAAGNTWMDALAAARRSRGMAAVSLAWGAWGESGMFARLGDGDRARLRRSGLAPFSTAEGLAALDAALGHAEPLLVPCAFDEDALRARPDGPPAVLRALVPPLAVAASPAGGAGDLLAQVRAEVARGLGLPGPGSLPLDEPLRNFGLDSLLALDIRERLSALTDRALPATILFDYPTVRAVAVALQERPAAEAAPEAAPEVAVVSEALDAMDDDDLLLHALAMLSSSPE